MRNCCGELLPCCIKSQQGRNQTEPQALVIGLFYTDAATGYLKLGARYYNPTTGRFTQPDPSGKEANTYNYAGCNPVNNTDPTGHMSCGLAWVGLAAGAEGFYAGTTALVASALAAPPTVGTSLVPGVIAYFAGALGLVLGLDAVKESC